MADSYNVLKADIRNHLLADAPLIALVSTRIFGSDLATLRDVVFPVLTFSMLGGTDDLFIQRVSLQVQAWSSVTYDEAHNVFNAARDAIGCVNIPTKLQVAIETSPVERYDEVSRLYSVTGRFRVVRLLDI